MVRLALAFFIGLLFVSTAHAHEGRPLLIKLNADDPTKVTLRWQVPPVMPKHAEPAVRLSNCTANLEAPHGLIGESTYDCGQGLGGAALTIHWPSINPALSTLVDVAGVDTRFYGPEVTQIPLSDLGGSGLGFQSFIGTGVEHILSGFDHLLFILALTLIVWQQHDAARVKRLALMVTGFTLAHSLTLALSTFGLIRLAAAPVEATIALSILFVCVELMRGLRSGQQETLTWRYPALTASAFGLLHGLGFASVLNDAGLGEGERLLGLLGFNLGVEIGQLAFVALALSAGLGLARLAPATLITRGTTLLVFAMGTLSASWMFERIAQF